MNRSFTIAIAVGCTGYSYPIKGPILVDREGLPCPLVGPNGIVVTVASSQSYTDKGVPYLKVLESALQAGWGGCLIFIAVLLVIARLRSSGNAYADTNSGKSY